MNQKIHKSGSKMQISETKARIGNRESIEIEQFVRVLAEIAKRAASTDNHRTKQEDKH
ncbi:MAG: hypothetical protein RLP44_09570 [Aggregatilineales bacterium]